VVTVGQYGAWTFIGAEQISGGYEVALHLPGSDQYTVWNTDTDGNVVSNATGGIVSGSSNALKSLELSFQQDLNGDGAMAAASLPGYQARIKRDTTRSCLINPLHRR
jgi:serralysin